MTNPEGVSSQELAIFDTRSPEFYCNTNKSTRNRVAKMTHAELQETVQSIPEQYKQYLLAKHGTTMNPRVLAVMAIQYKVQYCNELVDITIQTINEAEKTVDYAKALLHSKYL